MNEADTSAGMMMSEVPTVSETSQWVSDSLDCSLAPTQTLRLQTRY